jgi:hypothetical protein
MAYLKDYIKNNGPFDVLVMVVKAGRVLGQAIDNYNIAKKVHKLVPVVCVATWCENYDPMQKWVTEHDVQRVMNESGLVCLGIVATCFASGGRNAILFDSLRRMSANATWQAITDASNTVLVAGGVERETGNPGSSAGRMVRLAANGVLWIGKGGQVILWAFNLIWKLLLYFVKIIYK